MIPKEEVQKRKRELVTSRNTHVGSLAVNGEEIADMFNRCQSRAEFFENGIQNHHVPTERVKPAKPVHRGSKRFEERVVSYGGKQYRYYQEVVMKFEPVNFGSLASVLNGKRIR